MNDSTQSAPVGAGQTTIEFDDGIVRWFMCASIFWSIIAMAVGVLIATQLNFWQANFNTAYLTFGRIRPLHTNAAIFAFVGNMIFAGVYYSTQRLCKCRLASTTLSWIHFWGWQLIIVGAAITLPLGLTRGKEYAELIWPINIAVAVIWIIFGINFFWTLARRNEATLYVALWFYIATIITVAMLYVINHLSLPSSLLHSYPVFGGVQDALVEWWYGHNAVAFFLTTPVLGIMYYFLPKAAERPVYSYRLSVIHFWSLVFVYIWAGPHHLLNSALPAWLQTLGMIFSLMLWAPSWGGMLNGLLTLRGGWDKLRTDPVIKFFAAGVTFYGMSTFEGPLLAIPSVNALAHYTDWIIAHVHGGTLGWNGFMAAGMFYWLAPRLWNTKLYSTSLANLHFWIGMVGVLLYVGSMWVSGITQGLMLNQLTPDGLALKNQFLETVQAIHPMLATRMIGGTLYLGGFFLLVYNIWRTARSGQPVNGTIQIPAVVAVERLSFGRTFLNPPVVYCFAIVVSFVLWLLGGGFWSIAGLVSLTLWGALAIVHFELSGATWTQWYDKLLRSSLSFGVLTFIAVAIGGTIEILPTVTLDTGKNLEGRVETPFTPLELAGRDIYIREGCYLCHSQMIRTLLPDVMRYGDYSRLGESIYDHPFQWGSKRNGPDLAREGGVRPDDWHFLHLADPRSTSPGSIMPRYSWLYNDDTDYASLPAKINALRYLGVPYPLTLTPEEIDRQAKEQAQGIADELKKPGKDLYTDPDREIVAVIAYLQRLGKNVQDQTTSVAEAPVTAKP